MKHFAGLLKKATPVDGTNAVLKTYNIDGDIRILYRDQSDFEQIARQFGIFEEWKVMSLCRLFILVFRSLVEAADKCLVAVYITELVNCFEITYFFSFNFLKYAFMVVLYVLQDGVPRAAYKGVVVFRYKTQKRVFLASPDSLRQLGIR